MTQNQQETRTIPDAARVAFKQAVGKTGFIDDPAIIAPHLVDWRGQIRGRADLMLCPADSQAVARIVAVAARFRIALVPQGGNSSLCGASIPGEAGGEVILSLSRLSRIRVLADDHAVVEAGVILQDLHEAAARAGRWFPLSIASKGSATIGGLISTNAGGVQTLRWGNMRQQILGIEAVLPDGTVLDQLSPLLKDNSGYDVKQLLIGAEGTLGVVTAATVRLVPAPLAVETAFVACPDMKGALALLRRLRRDSDGRVDSFEFLPRLALDLLFAFDPHIRDPFPQAYDHYVLCELSSAQADTPNALPNALKMILEDALAQALQAGEIVDAVLAQSRAQAHSLWHLRETVPEAERHAGRAVKNDVSVPVARLPSFLDAAGQAVAQHWPDARVLAFGHLGDGNVHYNILAPDMAHADDFVQTYGRAITMCINDIVCAHGGSIAAEHGVGILKRDELIRLGARPKLAMMRAIKQALDPHNLMNPGKIL